MGALPEVAADANACIERVDQRLERLEQDVICILQA